jgi:hypothetical protein
VTNRGEPGPRRTEIAWWLADEERCAMLRDAVAALGDAAEHQGLNCASESMARKQTGIEAVD